VVKGILMMRNASVIGNSQSWHLFRITAWSKGVTSAPFASNEDLRSPTPQRIICRSDFRTRTAYCGTGEQIVTPDSSADFLQLYRAALSRSAAGAWRAQIGDPTISCPPKKRRTVRDWKNARTRKRVRKRDPVPLSYLCLTGFGMAQVMEFGVEKLLADGQLIELFSDEPDERFPLYGLYPSRKLSAG
jgi:DNA-binding transcriptional LysR family regulator